MKPILSKLLLVLLALVLLLPACAGGENTAETTAPVTSTSPTTTDDLPPVIQYDEWGREMLYSSLPDNLDFDDMTITFLTRDTKNYHREFFATAEDTDILSSAVYDRNSKVEEQLGIVIKVETKYAPAGVNSEYNQAVESDYLGQNGAYDIVAPYAYFGISLVTRGYFYDLNKLPYLDLDAQWWNQSYRNEISVYDKEYAAAGDIVLSSTANAYILFFNKNMLNNILPDYNIYDVVREGKWTLDEFVTLTQQFYQDDGNSIRDFNDRYGFSFTAECGLQNGWEPALGIRVVNKTGDEVSLNVTAPYITNVFGDLYEALCLNQGVLKYPRTTTSIAEINNKFASGSSLMTMNTLSFAETGLTSMEEDFGILPIPKYTEEDDYHTTPQDGHSFIAVMGHVKNDAAIGATLEALAYGSYMNVIPSYYEVAMKHRYLRTENSDDDIQMYDIIINSFIYDFGVMYSSSLGNVSNVIRNLITKDSPDYISTINGRLENTQGLLDDLLETLRELE